MTSRHQYIRAPHFPEDYTPCCVDDAHEGDVHIREGRVFQDVFGVPMTYTCAECVKRHLTS